MLVCFSFPTCSIIVFFLLSSVHLTPNLQSCSNPAFFPLCPSLSLCRASNINWHSVPLPKPARQLWNEIAQELCNHDKNLVKRLKQTRKQLLNDEKKSRNEAWRLTDIDRHKAETSVYNDYEDFYYRNRVNARNKLDIG